MCLDRKMSQKKNFILFSVLHVAWVLWKPCRRIPVSQRNWKIKDWWAKPKKEAGPWDLEKGERRGKRGEAVLRIYWRSFSRSCLYHKQLKPQGDIPQTCQLYPFMLRAGGSNFHPECCYYEINPTLQASPCQTVASNVPWNIQQWLVKLRLKIRHWYPGGWGSSAVRFADGVITASFDMTRGELWLERYCSSADKLSGSSSAHHNVNVKLTSSEHLQHTA